MTDQEQQMILAARRGQAEGFRYLVERYGRRVQLLVAQTVGDSRDAEELTQDAFVRAFSRLSDFDPQRASFSTWLCRIAYRTALNHLRSRGLATTPLREEHYPQPDVPLWEELDGDGAGGDLRLALLDKAIDRLRPQERTLLHLRYFEEHSLAEIAEVMDVAEGPLANRLQRLRWKLRKLMGI